MGRVELRSHPIWNLLTTYKPYLVNYKPYVTNITCRLPLCKLQNNEKKTFHNSVTSFKLGTKFDVLILLK